MVTEQIASSGRSPSRSSCSPVATAPRSHRRDAFPVTVAAANGKVTLDEKPVRIVSLSPTATEDAVRDRRRAAGDRGRRPVELPGEGAADEALRLHAERRGDRRLQARPRRRLDTTRAALVDGARRSSTSRCSLAAGGAEPRRRLRADRRSSATATGHDAGARSARREDAGADRGDRRLGAEGGAGADRLPRARARTSTRRPRRRSSASVYALLGLREHRRRGRQDGLRAIRSSRPSTSSPPTPT